jgi:hypothetical protein
LDLFHLGLQGLAVFAPDRPELQQGRLAFFHEVEELDRISIQVLQGGRWSLGSEGESNLLACGPTWEEKETQQQGPTEDHQGRQGSSRVPHGNGTGPTCFSIFQILHAIPHM